MSTTRLIDLHCDWILQYSQETTLFDPAHYPGIDGRLGQTEGYLQNTSAAVFACFRTADDWSTRSDPWKALGDLITRIEAEFPGRLLIDRNDFSRWRSDANGLCWGVLGIEGFDSLIRTTADLDRLPSLFDRGVRVFQPVYTADNLLAGSASDGDDRGLTDLGRGFLDTLSALAIDGLGPRPLLDLAHMNPRAASDVLTWFEHNADRIGTPLPIYSHGAVAHEGFATSRAISRDNLARLRAIGGTIGVCPSFYETTDLLKASIEDAAALPFKGRPGYEGITIGTDFMGVDRTLPGLGNVSGVIEWVRHTFDPSAASAILSENARSLLATLSGDLTA